MPAITFDHWERGLDVRQGQFVASADSLRELKNCYITTGRAIRKRPGLSLYATMPANTHGFTIRNPGGKFVFYDAQHGTITPPYPVAGYKLTSIAGTPDIAKILTVKNFGAYFYVVAEYADGRIQHHYIDGSVDTKVTDANCPQRASVGKIASKVWSIGTTSDTVRFSATDNPRDWTTASDAGFLPTSSQAGESADNQALGDFNGSLVVFQSGSAQIWTVDPDPANHAFVKQIDVGALASYAHDGMAGDLLFLSSQGIRSITMQATNSNLYDTDVGTAIDSLIKAESIDPEPYARYIRKLGQFWMVYGQSVYVYTFSRISKITAWSYYEFPVSIDYISEDGTDVYIRSGDDIYLFSEENFADYLVGDSSTTPTLIECYGEMPYQNFKSPGSLKMVHGFDAIATGNLEIAFKYDASNSAVVTPYQTISGDSSPGTMNPVEVCATSIAPIFRHEAEEEFQLDAIRMYYEPLGAL